MFILKDVDKLYSLFHVVSTTKTTLDKKIGIILSTRAFSSKPAISIEFDDVDSKNLAGYEERTRVLYMIKKTFNLLQDSIKE